MAEQEQQQTGETQATPQAGQEGAQETAVQHVEPKQAAPVERPHVRRRGAEASPFAMMRHLIDEMDRAFSTTPFGIRSPISAMTPFELVAAGGWVPAIESFEKEGRLVFRAELPGIRAEDVQVEIIGNDLMISGERLHEERETEGGSFYSERQYGCFERRVPLPEGCDPESVEATFDEGVLTVSLAAPSAKQKGRTIEVKSKSSEKHGGEASKGEIH